MNMKCILTAALVIALAGCSWTHNASESSYLNKTNDPDKQASSPQAPPGVGEASGTFTAEGDTVALKYAYAGKALRFGKESLIVLVTDKAIPKDEIADEMKSQTKLYAGEIRGLEYAIEKDGFWVMFHPAGYQESSPRPMKGFSMQNGIVRGEDEDDDLSRGKYKRSVIFNARLQGER